jgi:hypothetical protein
MNVNSGKRVDASFEGFSGTVGFVEREDGAAISFRSPLPLRVSAGDPVTADGRDWTVEKIDTSPFVRGFKLIELRPKEA